MSKNIETKPVIGIIGGTGKMGRLLEKFFLEKGLKVFISSTKTQLTNAELAQKSDVVIVSVPLDKVISVIDEVIPHVKEEALLCDISAVKEEPVKAMLKSRASVVGIHPVFGPMVKSFKNQTIVLCPARGDRWFGWLEDIFKEAGAKLQITTPEEHDKMMAIIQGLVHFTSITSAYTLKNLQVDMLKTVAFASPNYRIATGVIGRIMAQNPEVYADISMHNKYMKDVASQFLKSGNELFQVINKKDKDGFQVIFKESADYLGSYKERAMDETSYIIEKIAEHDEEKPF